jgi:hypothetical protein
MTNTNTGRHHAPELHTEPVSATGTTSNRHAGGDPFDGVTNTVSWAVGAFLAREAAEVARTARVARSGS